MNLTTPRYDSKEQAYLFEFHHVGEEFQVQTEPCFLEPGSLLPPSPSQQLVQEKEDALIRFFVENTKTFFASPIREATLKKRLQHTFLAMGKDITPEHLSTWVRVRWSPVEMKIRKTEFILGWAPVGLTPSDPQIAPDFLASVTPRVQSPVHTFANESIKQIHISNPIEYPQTAEGLVAIGDLPLSDGVVDFGLETESPEKAEERRRIREARLRASLAKLKAERLTNRYYQRYGSQTGSDSSDLSESETSSESS